MKAVVLQEYGGPEKLKFEDDVPEPQISGGTVLIAAAAISTVLPLICGSGTSSSNFSFSGPPYSCSTTAFIAYLRCR